jgi:hypothetical protein
MSAVSGRGETQQPTPTVGMARTRPRSDGGDSIRDDRAWVCRNGGCDDRELVGDA